MTSQRVGTPIEGAAENSPAARRDALAQVDEALERGLVSTNAAFGVVLACLGLLALGLVVTRLDRRIRPAS